MLLEDLGYNNDLEEYRNKHNLCSFGVARVISEHRERYMVKTDCREFEAEVIGNLRYTARERPEYPAVGDWVAISEYAEDKVLIHAVFPRKSILQRTAVGKYGEKQIIATNIDYALIMQAVDRDFNLNRIERYLAICYNSGVKPILVFNKTDLITVDELNQILKTVEERIKYVKIIPISNQTKAGYDDLLKHIFKGDTYCLLGSSGVGKSTLINNISGRSQMKTDSISKSTKKGRHVTSHRELFIMDDGGLLIDNPGMREVGIADSAGGIETVHADIARFSGNCRYKNCTHVHETGCAVIQALENGQIDAASYDNYLKMVKESRYFETSQAEKKKREKTFGKIVKDYKRFKKRNEE